MKKNKLNDGHYVEALDRLFLITEMMDTHLMGHPVIKKNKEIKKLIEFSIINLLEAYQRVGNETHEKKFERPQIGQTFFGRREKPQNKRVDNSQKVR